MEIFLFLQSSFHLVTENSATRTGLFFPCRISGCARGLQVFKSQRDFRDHPTLSCRGTFPYARRVGDHSIPHAVKFMPCYASDPRVALRLLPRVVDRVNLKVKRSSRRNLHLRCAGPRIERSLESADKFAPDLRSGRRLHRFAQGTVLSDRPQETRGYIIIVWDCPRYVHQGAPLVYSPLLADHRRQEARGFSTLQIPRTRPATAVPIESFLRRRRRLPSMGTSREISHRSRSRSEAPAGMITVRRRFLRSAPRTR